MNEDLNRAILGLLFHFQAMGRAIGQQLLYTGIVYWQQLLYTGIVYWQQLLTGLITLTGITLKHSIYRQLRLDTRNSRDVGPAVQV